MWADINAGLAPKCFCIIGNIVFLSDFAVRNCVVTESNTVKLGDYGLSRQVFKVSQ